VRNILGNQTTYLKSYLVQLPDKEIFFTHPILNNVQRRHTDNSPDKAQRNKEYKILVWCVFYMFYANILTKTKREQKDINIEAKNQHIALFR
jgi:hypothetical protein